MGDRFWTWRQVGFPEHSVGIYQNARCHVSLRGVSYRNSKRTKQKFLREHSERVPGPVLVLLMFSLNLISVWEWKKGGSAGYREQNFSEQNEGRDKYLQAWHLHWLMINCRTHESTNLTISCEYFGFPAPWKWDLRSFEILCRVERQFSTDVSVQTNCRSRNVGMKLSYTA